MSQNVKIKDLILLKNNPRKISKEEMRKLCDSIKEDPEFLQKRPVLVNKTEAGMEVYAGNMRVRAARALGWKEIPCDVDENIDAKILRQRALKDNRSAGDWDWDMIANEWEVDELLEAGFSLEEMGMAKEVAEEKDSKAIEIPKDPKTKPGDIYELISINAMGSNSHFVGCGDSCDPDFVEKVLNGAKPILCVTDPPYGVNYDAAWREGKGGKAGKHKRSIGKVQNDNKFDWSKAFSLFLGNIIYCWHANKFASQIQNILEDCDFEIISQIIWVKQNFAISRGDYHWQHEPCWYAIRKKEKHNWQGSRKESTVWEISSMSAFGANKEQDIRTDHSTQKPLECMAKPIRNNTALGESVYDPFIGSGTTLIAAQQLERNCYGIEIAPEYVDIIIERWKKFMEDNGLKYEIKKKH